MRLEEKIADKVAELISDDPALFVVEVSLKGTPGNQKLWVALDGEQGVQIDRCALVSRKLGHWIEEENLIETAYNLEVSSAGMGSPLKLLRQYKKNEGRQVEVTLKEGGKVQGKLIGSDEHTLKLEVKEEVQEIAFKEIEKTIVVVSFK